MYIFSFKSSPLGLFSLKGTMFFWAIFIITLIILLAVAWVLRPYVVPFFRDSLGWKRAESTYWIIWLLVIFFFATAVSYISESNIDGGLAAWVALLILFVGLSYSVKRGYINNVLSLGLLIIILILLGWLIMQCGITSTSGLLLLIVWLWLVIIMVGFIRAMI